MGLYSDKIFPWIIERLEGPEVYRLRERCIASVEGHVLEIGFGTGKTLPFYGSGVASLTIVEPSVGMNRKTVKLLTNVPFPTHISAIKGERLPFDDNEFDAGVCTMTLCSVDDPSQVLSEIRRVLKPDGLFYFLEHVKSDDPAIASKQHRFNPVQRIIGCGCNLIRETEAEIVRMGFEIVRIEHLISEDMPGFDARMYPLILGQARNTKVSDHAQP